MLQAFLNGKLSREQENMEDILTSNVFGLLRYLEPTEGVLKFLQLAEDIHGNHPLKWMSDIKEEAIEKITYSFWPWWKEKDLNGCEPDVVLNIDLNNKKRYLIVIEAKYLSGKSSEADFDNEAPTDQLAREWANLESISKRENYEPLLIYLTTDVGLPIKDIYASIVELHDKNICSNPNIYWLSWRHLYSFCANSEDLILLDIKALLDRLGLKFYKGINFSYKHGSYSWQFEKPPIAFDWNMGVNCIDELWRYHQ